MASRASLLFHIKRAKLFPAAILIIALLLIVGVAVPAMRASAVSGARDCDANAVIRCGATTTSEMWQKYSSQSDVQAIFAHYGISSSDVQNLHATAVHGYVTRGGRVIFQGQTLATNAITAGRQNMAGSQAITSGGTTFYQRPPSVSFQEQKLDAFIVRSNGHHGDFRFAILTSCGNPVIATPVQRQRPAPAAPTVQRPAPPPAPVVPAITNTNVNNNNVNVQVQQQQQQQQKQAQKQAPKKYPAKPVPQQPAVTSPATVTPTAPTTLPNTGAGTTALAFAGVTTTFGTLGRFLYIRRKLSGS